MNQVCIQMVYFQVADFHCRSPMLCGREWNVHESSFYMQFVFIYWSSHRQGLLLWCIADHQMQSCYGLGKSSYAVSQVHTIQNLPVSNNCAQNLSAQHLAIQPHSAPLASRFSGSHAYPGKHMNAYRDMSGKLNKYTVSHNTAWQATIYIESSWCMYVLIIFGIDRWKHHSV